MQEFLMDLTDKAVELMRKADAGDADAQYAFATYLLYELHYSIREGLHPEEVERALNYLRMAAAQGYFVGLAALDLGDIYSRGEIVPRDNKKARMWYNTALLSENPPAACMLGDFAYHGYDCEINHEEAAEYYLQAAPKYVDALYRLGDMYLRGEYFPADPEFARRLYEHVLEDEAWFYQKQGFYSDAYEQAITRIDELERNGASYRRGMAEETEKQSAARAALMKIMQSKSKRLKNPGSEFKEDRDDDFDDDDFDDDDDFGDDDE
jgi:TPR repeat protein